jgi:hypothetical protein
MTALFALVLTVFDAVLIVGWQFAFSLTEGRWHALPLSSVLSPLASGDSKTYMTVSIDKIERTRLPDLLDALLQIPLIVPLLLGAVLLAVFYSWLSEIEKRYAGKQRLHANGASDRPTNR